MYLRTKALYKRSTDPFKALQRSNSCYPGKESNVH